MQSRNDDAQRFMALFEAHRNAAFNLARWLLRDEAAAQDVTQDSFVRAYAALSRFDGVHPKAWLLTIVRNRCYTWLKQNAASGADPSIDDDAFDYDAAPELANRETPEVLLSNDETRKLLHKALEDLPPVFRETVILKELEELSYKEIAAITQTPIGTVMSRLARGRALLKDALTKTVDP